MSLAYLITPVCAWFIAGISKFCINCIVNKRLAFDLIGYGGMPSNHSAIVSSTLFLIFFKEGLDHPSFGVALTLTFIVLLDANSLRNQIGKHAIALNSLNKFKLRERVGHTKIQILAGCIVGFITAFIVDVSGL